MRSLRRLAPVVVAALALALPAGAQARSADVTDADVSLRLAPDGSLLVSEHLTFDYNGHFEGSYRDIDLLHGERIADVALSQGGTRFEPGGAAGVPSHDRPGVYGTTMADADTFRVVWHYRATDEQRTYTLSYRVVDAVVAYDDVLDVGWAVWGSEWDFTLDRLAASFTNPALDPADPLYRVWGHPRDVEGETVRGDSRATLRAEDVKSGTAVEMRVTLPRDPARSYPAARHVSGDGLPRILAEEKALDDDFNSPLNRFKRFVARHALVLSLGIAVLAWLLVLLLAWLAREHETSVPEYLPEPPDDATPALAYGLANEGRASRNTVLATLLDLVDRGYYDASQATTDDEKLDLAIARRAERPPEPLTDYEQTVLGFFDELLGDETVAISAMKDRVPEHSEVWRGRWERMIEALDDADSGQLAWDRDLNGLRWLVAAGAALLLVVVGVIAAAEREPWVAGAIVGAIAVIGLMVLSSTRFKRLDADHVERTARWQAFARWTDEFPRLHDDPPATLALWKRILVYGVAFGTAERMLKSGRIPEPVAVAAASGAHWSSYALASGFDSSAFNASGFSSAFSSQVAPESSGGGGGFSGGGGGFSGGGGGGSW